MKVCPLAVAATAALMLSACGGAMSAPKGPAWADATACQSQLPETTDFTDDTTLGGPGSVVVVLPDDKQGYVGYVVNPKDGHVEKAIHFRPDQIKVVLPMEDRVAGSLTLPPRSPPPPPIGQDRLRYLVALASRITMTTHGPCRPAQVGKDPGLKAINP